MHFLAQFKLFFAHQPRIRRYYKKKVWGWFSFIYKKVVEWPWKNKRYNASHLYIAIYRYKTYQQHIYKKWVLLVCPLPLKTSTFSYKDFEKHFLYVCNLATALQNYKFISRITKFLSSELPTMSRRRRIRGVRGVRGALEGFGYRNSGGGQGAGELRVGKG